MRVVAKHRPPEDTSNEADLAEWPAKDSFDVTPGREYEVYSIVIYLSNPDTGARKIFYLIHDDHNMPTWFQMIIFDVVDQTLPNDWICNPVSFSYFVIGPSFIAESEESYESMVNRDRISVDLFNEYRLK